MEKWVKTGIQENQNPKDKTKKKDEGGCPKLRQILVEIERIGVELGM